MAQMIEVLGEAPLLGRQAQGRFYQPELDGLRFYAFLGVFICHALPNEASFYRGLHLPMPWLWAGMVRSGGAGVDLFFALSAFLITSLVLKERQETGKISLKLFYIRRILRIWPLYFLVVALGILLAHTMSNHSISWFYEQSLPSYYVAGYLLFVSNWVYAVFGAAQSICAPLWTVSIEEQFYLIWPALMKVSNRRGMIVAAMITFMLAMGSQAGVVLTGGNRGYIVFGSASRCESLALGVLLALCSHRLARPMTRGRFLLVASGLVGWVISSCWLSDRSGPADMPMVLGHMIVSLGAGAILYGCLQCRGRIFTGDWVVRLGKVSYGLYMLHFTGLLLVATAIRPVGRLELLASKALGFVMTLILAFASYRWIESPFLRLKERFSTVLSRPV
jgi:peptidoglycan/LPS O-acetylase OafA/YrhL